ncbi:hypothetical protein BURPSPAST_H0223 [Burkholderia pseudomallei Pasteur 52237]|nr:hypothetical protein BURPSPAST_H0223 [Burkholderia pseudomallei Pasteur 52237]
MPRGVRARTACGAGGAGLVAAMCRGNGCARRGPPLQRVACASTRAASSASSTGRQ